MKVFLAVIALIALFPVVCVGAFIGVIFTLLYAGFTFGVDLMDGLGKWGEDAISDYERRRTHTIRRPSL